MSKSDYKHSALLNSIVLSIINWLMSGNISDSSITENYYFFMSLSKQYTTSS